MGNWASHCAHLLGVAGRLHMGELGSSPLLLPLHQEVTPWLKVGEGGCPPGRAWDRRTPKKAWATEPGKSLSF